jgi:Ca-activated chloride channel family protein
LVVITHLTTTEGRPDADGAAAAVDAEIPVSTIAFGTERGTITLDGQVQPVPVEIPPLEDIAATTGGEFFQAESLQELTSVYADIGSSIGFDIEQIEVTERFVGYAVVALLVSAALSLLWFQRIP